MNKYTYITIVALVILAMLAGVVSGHFIWPVSKTIVGKQLRENSPDYKYINPLLLVSNTGIGKAPEYGSITQTLTDYVNREITQKNADDVSVYFSDLDSGLYSGVNETHQYSPASMLKVAVLIVCLQTSEGDPGFLDKTVYVDPKSPNLNVSQFYPPQNSVTSGKEYTVKDLIEYMIADSDNNATVILDNLVGDDKVENLLKELQLPQLTQTNANADFMSPQLYSRLYRILYNSTYLSPDVSEEALNFLVEKDFPQGLYAGVPVGIEIAQKYGERAQVDQLGKTVSDELHDCGIVYLPGHPYFLCVMTKGQDFTKLQPIISDVSKMVWSYFSGISGK